ncbi:MAG: ATP-dependent DNA helicase RecG [Lachnospiraceae bacterium]|nr:ATP-dependent DNA helicase RecG [Lachnospiraceae bacterium]
MHPDSGVENVKGVGEKTALALKKLGIVTVDDALHYWPRSYEMYALPQDIKDIREGEIASVECLVTVRPQMIRARGLVIVSLTAGDGTGSVKLVWYNAPFITKTIYPGTRYIFRGHVLIHRGELTLNQPAVFKREEYVRKMSRLWPVYPLKAGVTNNMLTKLIAGAYEGLDKDDLKDYLSPKERRALDMPGMRETLEGIHFPETVEDFARARRRLVFDEFTGFMTGVRKLKENRIRLLNTHPVRDYCIWDEIRQVIDYELTGAQERVLEELKGDFSGEYSAARMIQGDVGSGKTIVAIFALAAFARAGFQGCIMAPTDVLARQHFDSFCSILHPFGIRCVLLTGAAGAAQKKEIYRQIKEHEADIIIGTHALIQDKVEYADLGLAIIDEQHRFGVKQREILSAKGNAPHVVVMSATPIPRSLAIILYGDLELSLIDEMPKNRLPIKNCVVDTDYRSTAYKFIRKQVEEGHQAYIICPMIDENDETEAENVLEYTERVRKILCGEESTLPNRRTINVEYLHGRMKPAEKAGIMERFAAGEIDVLISTTVIEVGVNVANATVMMVENSERFGLAQLHQLRGRVGRGAAQSYCIFIKGIGGRQIDERLNILVQYNDGMKVAEADLKNRGPGDLFGVRQSGDIRFTLADIYGDADILKLATDYVNGLDEKELERICSVHIQKDSLTI